MLSMFANEFWREAALSVGGLLGAVAAGLAVHATLFGVLRRFARRTSGVWDEKALDYISVPSRSLFPLIAIRLSLPALRLPPRAGEPLSHILSLLFIGAISLLLVHLIYLLRDFLLSRYDLNATDNLAARKIHTQIRVLEKVLLSIVAIAAIAFMLMTFDGIRQVGVSLLASAGIAGIIIGLAAQKSIGTLLAGIQIAISQPIRMDDVVIVEGEWGWIEEINLTYVVVRIWDLRRLIVPINYFIEKPFQNWTRASADLLGTVFLYMDYSVPVEALRRELERLIKTSKHWDGKVCVLQVTDCKESVVEIRLLASAASASDAFDVRCYLRERMIEFIRIEYPGSLPRMRAELTRSAATAETDAGQSGAPQTATGAKAEKTAAWGGLNRPVRSPPPSG